MPQKKEVRGLRSEFNKTSVVRQRNHQKKTRKKETEI